MELNPSRLPSSNYMHTEILSKPDKADPSMAHELKREEVKSEQPERDQLAC